MVMQVARAEFIEYCLPRVLKNKTNIDVDLVIFASCFLDFLKRPRALTILTEPYFYKGIEKINISLIEVGNLKDNRKALCKFRLLVG